MFVYLGAKSADRLIFDSRGSIIRTYYTIEFKLKVLVSLDANNGNIYGTARQFGIPRQTVSNWSRDRELIFEQSQQEAEERRLPITRRLTLMINQIVDSLPDKVEQAKLGDATRALSIMLELKDTLTTKEAVEQEQSNDVYEKLARLLERYGTKPSDDETP